MVEAYTAFVFFVGLGCAIHFLSRHFQAAHCISLAGVRPWAVSAVAFAQFVWCIITLVFCILIAFPYIVSWVPSALPKEVLGALVFQFCLFLFICCYYKFNKNFNEGLCSKFYGVKQLVVLAFYVFFISLPIVGLLNYAWLGLLSLLKSYGIDWVDVPQTMVKLLNADQPLSVLLMIAVPAIILAPINEEIIFRGAIYRFLKGRMNPWWALSLSSFLFALTHQHMATLLPLFCLGMLLGYCYERTGNLWVSVVFHSLFNLNTYLLILIKKV